MAKALYTEHPNALKLLFSEIDAKSRQWPHVFVGTPGSVLERTKPDGFRFYAHQFYGPGGRKHETYVAGPVGNPEADEKARALRELVQEIQHTASHTRLLAREGYSLLDRDAYASIASLHNFGVFLAGGVLIGSHAYGVLLNAAGVTPASGVMKTEDVDLGMKPQLALPSANADIVEILRTSMLDLVPVPGLDPRLPATSFKKPGKSHFQVDLLVGAPTETYSVVPIPALKAHATGLAYLDYLIEGAFPATAIGREGACRVSVPSAERFAVHKLVVASIRHREPKAQKDLAQAAVLLAFLADTDAPSIREALLALPQQAHQHLMRSIERIRALLSQSAPNALELLSANE